MVEKKAPSFTGLTDDGKKVRLSDFKGQTLILYFYPKDLTPGCTDQAKEFQKLLKKFEKKGAQIVGVSRDSIERHQNFRKKLKLTFPLISDESGELCEAYGVWQEKSLYGRKFMGIVRSTFVISPQQKIVTVYSKVRVKGHVQKVLEELAS